MTLLLFIVLVILTANSVAADVAHITILATGDEHGTRMTDAGCALGPAEVMAYWRMHEGYEPGKFLTLSAGDFSYGDGLNITYKSDPILAAMNKMGYCACVIGNADCGSFSKRMPQWSSLADFPLLAANLVHVDGSPVKSVVPYTIVRIDGVKVGIIGLTAVEQSLAKSLDGETFLVKPYAESLRKYVPEVRQKGARVVIACVHEVHDAVVELAKETADLKIPLFLSAHDHLLTKTKLPQGTWVVDSGQHWHAYSRIELEYDRVTKAASVSSCKQVEIKKPIPAPDKDVKRVIDGWEKKVPDDYVQVGYTVSGLDLFAQAYSFVCDCMLAADPKTDVVVMADGYLRQGFPPGPISRMTIMDTMNYTNCMWRVELTGKQVLELVPKEGFVCLAGLEKRADGYFIISANEAINPAKTYRVLMPEYDYKANKSNYELCKADVAFGNWRDPVVEWFAQHPTTQAKPLENVWLRAGAIDR